MEDDGRPAGGVEVSSWAEQSSGWTWKVHCHMCCCLLVSIGLSSLYSVGVLSAPTPPQPLLSFAAGAATAVVCSNLSTFLSSIWALHTAWAVFLVRGSALAARLRPVAKLGAGHADHLVHACASTPSGLRRSSLWHISCSTQSSGSSLWLCCSQVIPDVPLAASLCLQPTKRRCLTDRRETKTGQKTQSQEAMWGKRHRTTAQQTQDGSQRALHDEKEGAQRAAIGGHHT